jgi:hypothetical protein
MAVNFRKGKNIFVTYGILRTAPLIRISISGQCENAAGSFQRNYYLAAVFSVAGKQYFASSAVQLRICRFDFSEGFCFRV